MGSPPIDFVQRSKLSSYFWDLQCQTNTSTVPVIMYRWYEGDWRGSFPGEGHALERRESALEGEEKVKLLKLMWKILQWRPQDRRSTEDIWDDEWFSTDLEAVKPETYAGLD